MLAGLSVAYNGVEAAVAITAGAVASSSALVGFGLDSIVEVSSGLVILWQFRGGLGQARERQAQRAIALSCLALAAYVAADASIALLTQAEPDPSVVGIVLAVLSLAVMPVLSRAQRRTGRALHSSAVVSDSAQTMLCSWLSAVLLVGLLLTGCSAGTSPVETCVQHAVEEGVDRAAAQDACERSVG